MSRLTDLIKDTLQGTSHEQKHHGPGVAHGHAHEQEQAAPQAPSTRAPASTSTARRKGTSTAKAVGAERRPVYSDGSEQDGQCNA